MKKVNEKLINKGNQKLTISRKWQIFFFPFFLINENWILNIQYGGSTLNTNITKKIVMVNGVRWRFKFLLLL